MSDQLGPFRTWNGVEPHPFAPGVALHAIGGDQVLLCRVSYAPRTRIPVHAHEDCEQLMAIVDGEVTITVEGQSQTLGAGDVVAISRGREHEVYSEEGCTFFEALAPLPLDHVPDLDRDVVLGPDRGSGHVER